jgi:hypothetical protein
MAGIQVYIVQYNTLPLFMAVCIITMQKPGYISVLKKTLPLFNFSFRWFSAKLYNTKLAMTNMKRRSISSKHIIEATFPPNSEVVPYALGDFGSLTSQMTGSRTIDALTGYMCSKIDIFDFVQRMVNVFWSIDWMLVIQVDQTLDLCRTLKYSSETCSLLIIKISSETGSLLRGIWTSTGARMKRAWRRESSQSKSSCLSIPKLTYMMIFAVIFKLFKGTEAEAGWSYVINCVQHIVADTTIGWPIGRSTF